MAVFQLTTFILASHYNTCREMSNSYSGLYLIYVLPPLTTATVGINFQVTLFQVEGNFFNFRYYVDASKGGVTTFICRKRGNTNKSGHSTRLSKIAVCMFSSNRQGGIFNSF